MWGKSFVRGVAFLILGLAAGARAQTSTEASQSVSTTKVGDVSTEAPSKIWGIKASVTSASNLYGATAAAGGSRENGYLLAPSIKATPLIAVEMTFLYTHNLIQQQASDFENTAVTVRSSPIELSKELLKLKPSVSGLVPTNQKAREDESLQAAVGAAVGLSASLKKVKVPLTVDYGIAVRRNFHEFVRNDRGEFNSEYRLTNSLVGSVEFLQKFSLTSVNRWISNVAYSGTIKSSFELSQELGYQVSKQVSVSLGHSNAGSTLKSDAQSSNLQLIDENSSTVSAGLEVIY